MRFRGQPVRGGAAVVAVAALTGAFAVAFVVAGRVDASSRSPTAGRSTPSRTPALPRLGPIQTVDPNDVGDPFILPVPRGLDPPSDVPYVGNGPGAYQSAPRPP